MANDFPLPGYQLPSQPERKCSAETEGFFTPAEDIVPQVQSILPRRVLPIVFLPGIMGSNLRMSAARQERLGKKNNIAWRPDNLAASLPFINASAELRQLQLDPRECVVDEYDPVNQPTGDSS